MSECTCHKNYTLDTLIPQVGVITNIHEETPDVKTFCVTAPDGGKLFDTEPKPESYAEESEGGYAP